MRRLLILALVVAVGMMQGGPDAARAQIGYPYNAWLYLYHPTGISSATQAQLACGWHWDCDGVFGDADPSGLDWQWANGQTTVRVRSTIFLIGGPTSNTYVARMETTDITGLCPKRISKILRTTDWAEYGKIRQAHANGGGDQYSNLYGKRSGTSNTLLVGSMVDHNIDGCSIYTHVHQRYESSGGDYESLKNDGGFPTEQGCFHCNTLHDPWQVVEYIVKFWAY